MEWLEKIRDLRADEVDECQEDTTVEPTEYELDNRFNYDPRYEIDKYDSPGLDMNY